MGHSGFGYTEIRYFNPITQFFYKLSQDDFGIDIRNKTDTYVGINPRKSRSGTAKDIEWLTCLVVDIDPVREKGQASTDVQHEEALLIGWNIQKHYGEKVWIVDSGSGCHCYFPLLHIKVENAELLTKELKKWSDKIKEEYATTTQRIDSIFDLSRVIRVWGSHNNKSNRICRVVHSGSGGRFDWKFVQTAEVSKELVAQTDYEKRFWRLYETNERLKRLVDFGTQDAGYPSRSEADMAFISTLVKASFTPEQIDKLKVHNRAGRGEATKFNDIARIAGKLDGEITVVSTQSVASKYLQSLRSRKSGVKSGLKELDRIINGYRPGFVYVFGARPGTGKTSLVIQTSVALSEAGLCGLIFPTECGSEPLFDKVISQHTGVPLLNFQTGQFSNEELGKIEEASGWFSQLPLVISENFSLKIYDIQKEVDRIQPSFVVVDYIQAMKYGSINKIAEMDEVMRGLHEIATTRNIPVIVASQLNRLADSETLNMGHFKGSGSVEEISDVLFGMVTTHKHEKIHPVDFVCLKNKYGPVEDIRMMLDTSIGKFTDARDS